MKAPEIAVSWGELIDKITILEIKRARLKNESGRANVGKELELLQAKVHPDISKRIDVDVLKTRLAEVNEALWEIEDLIRAKEMSNEFDDDFIELARSVYKRNDERAAIKREINSLLDSEIVEEKSYLGRS
ncbi:MAG: DUF6165 family protein [Xanthobacteraceae bacterium]